MKSLNDLALKALQEALVFAVELLRVLLLALRYRPVQRLPPTIKPFLFRCSICTGARRSQAPCDTQQGD